MEIVQWAFLAAGIVGGVVIAWWLRQQIRTRPAAVGQRTRMLVAFGVGAAMWVMYALFFLSGPSDWLLLGTVVAMYLPALVVVAASRDAAS